MHFTQVRPNLWIGSWESARNEPLLQANGVTAVMNVCCDQVDPKLRHIKQIQIPLIDGRGNNRWQIDVAVHAMVTMLKASERVFIHCVAGRSRSPHIAALALAEIENSSYAKIYAEFAHLIRDDHGDSIWQPALIEGKY